MSLFLDTGLRLSELTELTLDDLDIKTGSILIKRGKRGKQRLVDIGDKAQKALRMYITSYLCSNSDRLFINRTGEPLETIGIKILIKRLGDKAKLGAHPINVVYKI